MQAVFAKQTHPLLSPLLLLLASSVFSSLLAVIAVLPTAMDCDTLERHNTAVLSAECAFGGSAFFLKVICGDLVGNEMGFKSL